MDVKKWLTDEMGFTADEIKDKGLDSLFETRAEKLDKGYLRLSDYSRNMDEVTKLKNQVTANNDKLTADMAEWADMTAAEKTKNGDLLKQIEEAKTKAYGLEQKLIRVAEENGIDPKTLIEAPVAKPVVKEPVAFDPQPIRDQIGGVANYMLDLSANLPWIVAEHKRLTGQDLDTRAFVAGIKADLASSKKDAILDPVKRWEVEFGIEAKRTEKSAAERAAELTHARAEERALVLSEQAVPGGSPRPGQHAPVFRTSNVAGGSKLQRPQPSDRLAGATAALATHKYGPETARKTA